jgi:hypothetical protein
VAAVLTHAVAPVGAPSVYSCGDVTAMRLLRFRTWWRPWNRQARRRWDWLYGELRGYSNHAAARTCVGSIKIKRLGAIR